MPNDSWWEDGKVQVITGSDLRKIFSVAAQVLSDQKEKINALNVFPVPDGDTGTNMALTLKSAIRELDNLKSDDISKVAAAIARGSLMGARGNSGVILSQFFRGFSEGLAKLKTANGKELAFAFQQASKTTYKAVMKPVEGTMLTVGRAFAEAGVKAVDENELRPDQVWEIGLNAGKIALANTPNILPVLKEAGVVDAGGEGLIVALEGAYRCLVGEVDYTLEEPVVQDGIDHEVISRIKGELENKYCTEFLIKGINLDVNRIRKTLDAKGDSLLVVGESDLIKVHIHTDRPGQILDICTKLGDLTDIKIDNMQLQNETVSEDLGNIVAFPMGKIVNATADEPKEIGIVAVVPGQGLAEIFLSLGVDKIIPGGQTMNPSTEELIRAVEEVNAKSVIILPNNKNVIFSAEQAKEFVEKKVEVIRCKTVPQGIAALIGFANHMDFEQNIKAMKEGMKHIHSGEITYAVRSTKAGELNIEEQDFIGLADGKIVAAGQSLTQVGMQVLSSLVNEDSSLISIYFGDNIMTDEAEAFYTLVQEGYTNCEVELYSGGQPLYYYILSVE